MAQQIELKIEYKDLKHILKSFGKSVHFFGHGEHGKYKFALLGALGIDENFLPGLCYATRFKNVILVSLCGELNGDQVKEALSLANSH